MACHSMPEQRCHHMQGKAAQTKRSPAARAVTPARANVEIPVRQSVTHIMRTSASRTSIAAVQVGLEKDGVTACLPGASGLPRIGLSSHFRVKTVYNMHQHAGIPSRCRVHPSGGNLTTQPNQCRHRAVSSQPEW